MDTRKPLERRTFLKAAGALTAVGMSSATKAIGAAATAPASESAKPIRKAVKLDMVQADSVLAKFKMLKELGFDGVEVSSPSDLDRNEVLAARDETGLPIHGVVVSTHWAKPFSHPDPAVREANQQGLRTAMQDAKFYGATSVLLVPAVVNKEIAYQDAYQRSQEEIRKALPLAEQLEMPIALENVWNNFLLSPVETARYIDEFKSPWVRAYFDIGNVLRYGWPEQWIRVLDKRILKLDCKEFSIKKMNDQGLWKGFGVELLEGDNDWPAVMKALREVGYNGWMTAEIPGGGRERMKDIATRMDKILAL